MPTQQVQRNMLRDPEKSRKYDRAYHETNKVRINEKHKAYYHTHKNEILSYKKREYQANPDIMRDYNWKRLGIHNSDGSQFTMIDYKRTYKIQQGKCAICKKHSTEFAKQLCADHSHQTGIIRGLVCNDCNTIVIKAVDDYNHLIKITQTYLKEKSC